jgi:CDP-diacylglycerol---glycerol-3-phosphate 3-phosphatidyltransferase
MTWNLPNLLTIARIVLSGGFFVLLGLYEPLPGQGSALMGVGFVVFVIAALTDIADGHIARKFDQVTAFGRIVDPFVDKVMVVGAFIMLAGPNFQMSTRLQNDIPAWFDGSMLTSVQTWMVVVILAREFVVSAIRGYSESQGKGFPAIAAGKIKMLLQSFTIGTILFARAWVPSAAWGAWLQGALVWATVAVTIFSGVIYVHKARGLFFSNGRPA